MTLLSSSTMILNKCRRVFVGHLGAEPPVAGVAGLAEAGVHAVDQTAFAGGAEDLGIQRFGQHGVDQIKGVGFRVGHATFHESIDVKIQVFDGVVVDVDRFLELLGQFVRQCEALAFAAAVRCFRRCFRWLRGACG